MRTTVAQIANELSPEGAPRPDEPEWNGNFEDYAREWGEHYCDWPTAQKLRVALTPSPEATRHE